MRLAQAFPKEYCALSLTKSFENLSVTALQIVMILLIIINHILESVTLAVIPFGLTVVYLILLSSIWTQVSWRGTLAKTKLLVLMVKGIEGFFLWMGLLWMPWKDTNPWKRPLKPNIATAMEQSPSLCVCPCREAHSLHHITSVFCSPPFWVAFESWMAIYTSRGPENLMTREMVISGPWWSKKILQTHFSSVTSRPWVKTNPYCPPVKTQRFQPFKRTTR